MSSAAPPPNKRLFVFCDGTDQDGLLSWEVYEDKTWWEKQNNIVKSDTTSRWLFWKRPKQDDTSDRCASNVFRLSRTVAPQAKDGTLQLVFYQSGIAVPEDFEGDEKQYLQIVSGRAVAAKIRDAYNFIAQNYSPGDKIYLFGFSRGAYTVRKVAGLLDKLGLLSKQQMSFFYRYWNQLYRSTGHEETGAKIGAHVDIEFLGVWDTVGFILPGRSVTPKANVLGLDDKSLPSCVKRARHAMSSHEERYEFLCTPFEAKENDSRLIQVSPCAHQHVLDDVDPVLWQLWFPGVHSDVGGGYQLHQIADLSLLWMAGEIDEIDVGLDKPFLDTRLSSGNMPLEVHHEYSCLPTHDGNRYHILDRTMVHETTSYHRSMWGQLNHVNPDRQAHLKSLVDRLPLNPKRTMKLNKLEEHFWSSRWARYSYIPEPSMASQPRGGVGEPEQVPHPSYPRSDTAHEAPEEDESPDALFRD